MKKTILSIANTARTLGAVIMIGLVSVTYTGCKQEGCTDVDANNYSEDADEDDGTCTYDRDAMIGSYSASGSVACGVTGTSTTTGLPLTVSVSTVSKTKIVVNLDGIALTATVSGTTFTIDNQTVDGFGYSGNGTISGNVLNVTINEFDSAIPETCVYTLNASRQ
jgi:hypothetical protein